MFIHLRLLHKKVAAAGEFSCCSCFRNAHKCGSNGGLKEFYAFLILLLINVAAFSDVFLGLCRYESLIHTLMMTVLTSFVPFLRLPYSEVWCIQLYFLFLSFS